MKYIYKMTSLKGHDKSIWWRKKLSKKKTRLNKTVIIKERYKRQLSFKYHSILRKHMFSKMWIFQTTQELVRVTWNLLVANMYWMIAFKIYVFDASLFDETPNGSNSKIWESFLSWIYFYHAVSFFIKLYYYQVVLHRFTKF